MTSDPTTAILFVVHLLVLGVAVFALLDAAIRPTGAWQAAVSQPKPYWVGGLALASVVAFFFGIGFLGVIALVASIYYLVDVRPKVRSAQGRGPR